MERSGTESSKARIGIGSGDGWEEWNAIPRDGPAVFVIDVEVADREGRIQGRWIDPTGTTEEIERQLGELLGRTPDEGSWAVVDQVGLGSLMVPEVLAATGHTGGGSGSRSRGRAMNEAEPVVAAAERGEEPTSPRIYVASLSDYNAGRLHGVWLDADQEFEVLHEGVKAMLAASAERGAEEWAIHDHQGFGAAELSEYESLETVARLGRGIAEHGPAFGAWAALTGLDSSVALDSDAFEEAYRGHWPSVTEYAEEMLDDLGATETLELLPDWLQSYVSLNVAGFARDLVLGGDIRTVEGDGGVWVFEAEK